MSRKRNISTDISTDSKVAELAEYGTLPLLLYTWAIPHMDDWGRITGDPRQFRLMVCPALDVSTKEVQEALNQIISVGLWTGYEVEGKKYISVASTDAWYKHQSYINKSKRDDDKGSNYPAPPNSEEQQETPNNTEDHQETPKKTASPSPSPSKEDDDVNAPARETETDSKFAEAYKAVEKYFGLAINPIQAEKLESYIADGLEPELVSTAAVITRERGKGVDFFWGILNNCHKKGILTLQAFQEDQAQFEAAKSRGQPRGQPFNKLSNANERLMQKIREEEAYEQVSGDETIPDYPKLL